MSEPTISGMAEVIMRKLALTRILTGCPTNPTATWIAGMRSATKKKLDIGILLNKLNLSRHGCGQAQYILADEVNAFAGVNVDCDLDQAGNVIAHEIGHLLGARHQFSSDDHTIPFEYGHAFEVPGEHQTLMVSYPCGSCTWHTAWSDPGEWFFSTTTPSGNEKHANNARVIALTGAYVASFKGGVETHPLKDTTPPSISAPADRTVEATGTLTSVPNLGSPTVSDNKDPSPTVSNNAPASSRWE